MPYASLSALMLLSSSYSNAPAIASIELVPELRVHIEGVETVAYDSQTDAFLVSASSGVLRVTRDGGVSKTLTNAAAAGEGAEVTHVAIHPSDPSRAFAAVLPPDPCASVGYVVEFHAVTGEIARRIPVGFHPDCVAIDPASGVIVVANEGEVRSCTFAGVSSVFDPFGSITLIIPPYTDAAHIEHITFDDALQDALARQEGIRLHPDALARPTADLEPEYITISDRVAYVSLQENNAIYRLDLETRKGSLHALPVIHQRVDADKGDGPSIRHTSPTLPMPDMLGTVAPPNNSNELAWVTAGLPFVLLSANEGDTRGDAVDGGPLYDEIRVEELTEEAQTGRPAGAKVSRFPTKDGHYPMFGSRSVSVYAPDTLERLSDTADAFEQWFLENYPSAFNANSSNPAKADNRSDDRGPEPEGIVGGIVNGRPLAFVTLERPGAIAILDLHDPFAPSLLGIEPAFLYGDHAPEGLVLISQDRSKNPTPELAVAYERSGTFVVYKVLTTNVKSE